MDLCGFHRSLVILFSFGFFQNQHGLCMKITKIWKSKHSKMNQLLKISIKVKSVQRASFVIDWQVTQSNPKRMSKFFLTGNSQPKQPCAARNYVTTLNICVKRGCATKSGRKTIPKRFQKQLLPFETETSAANDVLLFSFHQRERLCFLITLGGIFLFCVLLNSSELIYMTLNHVKPTSSNTNEYPWYYWWKKVNFNSSYVKYGASGSVFIFAFLALGFACVYPTRMIREITLLKGGEKILLQTYRPFGLTKTKEVVIKDISAQWGPAEAKGYLPLKVRGRRLPLLLNQDGTYHNQKLFDQTVGLYRF